MDKIRVIRTARDTQDRLTEKPAILSERSPLGQQCGNAAGGGNPADGKCAADRADIPYGRINAGVKLVLRPEQTYQKIVGFGGAFTESAAYTYSRMEPEKRREILKKYFDPEEGIGYSIGRVHINSCDFSLGNYTYVRDNDEALASFDISREEKWVIPLIRDAESVRGGGIKLLASPWSPPGWMKSNGEMNHGGMLLPKFREAWARYYAKYIKAMRARGVNIQAVTVQNEPAAVQTWDSCIWSAEEEGLFVRDYLGPILEKEGLAAIKIYVWDHNRDIIVERATGTLSVPGAARFIYGVADHWYCSEAFENLSAVHDRFPDKHLLFSEGCQEGGVQLGSWSTGERYGRNMIGEFSNWQEGWLDWNLVLDETGGPNHVGNLCDAPVIADTKTQHISYDISYYYIGQFSRFVKPGAVRIGLDAVPAADLQGRLLQPGLLGNAQSPEYRSALKQVAFMNGDGSVVMVIMNETDEEESFCVELNGRGANYTMPVHSIATFVFEGE